VEDINAKHAYGPSSAPIAQGLVYDINAPHAFGPRESKRTYGSVSTPIAQGLVKIINAIDTKMVMSPKAQGLVSNTHHSQTCMLKNCTHDRMSSGKGAKRTTSGSAGKKTTALDEAEGTWTTVTIRRKRTTRQADGRDNKSSDTGKLTLVANKYACLIKEDQIENNRKIMNVCKALLRTLHQHTVRKMISVKYARHPAQAGKLEKGRIGFKLPRIQKRRKMNPVENTGYPTSALDKGKIGVKPTRLEKRNKFWLQKKGGEMKFVYNNKVPIPHLAQLTTGFSTVSHKQTRPITTLSVVHHGSTQHNKTKRREKRKREHDTKDGKHQKLQENRKLEGKEQPDADKKTREKILTDCEHPNAKHYAIEKHEERLTVGDKKNLYIIRVDRNQKRISDPRADREKSNPAANFAGTLQGSGRRKILGCLEHSTPPTGKTATST